MSEPGFIVASILILLGRFPEVVRSAARRAEPSELCQYLLALSRDVSGWYVAHRVIGEDETLSATRLALVRGAKIVISNGLQLLGIAAGAE